MKDFFSPSDFPVNKIASASEEIMAEVTEETTMELTTPESSGIREQADWPI